MLNSGGDRRDFFRATIGRLGQEVADRTVRRVVVERFFRPPGAVDELSFLSLCTRCNKCIDVCPPRALGKAPPTAGLATGTPMIDMTRQPCIGCADMPCAAACPTGALVVPEQRWKGLRLGRLELDPDRCVAFQGVECGVCARACPLGTRAMVLDDRGRPVIKAEGCIGCGVCVRACVTTPPSLTVHHLTER
jgi:MauM/NapG family ferredoxin protein